MMLSSTLTCQIIVGPSFLDPIPYVSTTWNTLKYISRILIATEIYFLSVTPQELLRAAMSNWKCCYDMSCILQVTANDSHKLLLFCKCQSIFFEILCSAVIFQESPGILIPLIFSTLVFHGFPGLNAPRTADNVLENIEHFNITPL